jgi:hypothetical protein
MLLLPAEINFLLKTIACIHDAPLFLKHLDLNILIILLLLYPKKRDQLEDIGVD